MPSPEASCANGRKSRGPVTEQGKRNSSRNSRRHGVYAKSIVFDSASHARYSDDLASLSEELQPATPLEARLIETLARTRTRQIELWRIERDLIDSEIRTAVESDRQPSSTGSQIAAAYFTVLERSQLLDRLQTEDSSCDRRYFRALADLREARANRAHKMLFSGTNLTSDTKQSTGSEPNPSSHRLK